MRVYRITPLAARLWKHVLRTDACWEWQGSTVNGYGEIQRGGHSRMKILVHRAAWEFVMGDIPDGLTVHHTCDNRRCVRNDDMGTYEVSGKLFPRVGHLWLGTKTDNMRDMAAKRRQVFQQHPERATRGERVWNATLTPEIVRAIRARYDAGGVTISQVAREFGIQKTMARVVIRRIGWKHVA